MNTLSPSKQESERRRWTSGGPLLAATVFLATPAWANDSAASLAALTAVAPASAQDIATPAPAAATEPARERTMDMETNFRFRYLSVPNSVMDIWFFDSDEAGANPFERPKIRMYAFGLEYVLKPKPMNWIFYYEYVGSGIKEGYWDDAEEPADHDDGDWIKPSGFGMHVIGANYAHEIDVSSTDRAVWVSMLFSAGLGAGIVSGQLQTWHPGGNETISNECLRDSPAYERQNSCPDDGSVRLPGLLPILDLTMSARVNFQNKATARLDVGLHDIFYVGTAVGTVF